MKRKHEMRGSGRMQMGDGNQKAMPIPSRMAGMPTAMPTMPHSCEMEPDKGESQAEEMAETRQMKRKGNK